MSDTPLAGPPSPPRGVRWPIGVVGAVLVLIGVTVAWRWWAGRATEGGPATPAAEELDPRRTFPSPYRNTAPGVRYVGDQVCAPCHRPEFDDYRKHPMGQALAPVAEASPIERYDTAALNPFVVSGLHYGIHRQAQRVFHREWAAAADGIVLTDFQTEVHFAVGSGARARSYLVNHDGYLFQAPATWYPHGKRWALSPGYEVHNVHFTRPVAPGCLFCHCTSADPVPHTLNRYRQPIFSTYAIGCERCHGPGELHVARRSRGGTADGPDDTIVNPARLEHSLRQDVCYQCHLQGEVRVVRRGLSDFDYRPGLPLYLFLMDFVDGRERGADRKFVNAVEQLVASRCYRESREENRLGCTTCHDPHRHPAPHEKVGHYRERCLRCHTEHSCGLDMERRRRKHKDDSCVACHMPRAGSEVNHASITNHRIPRVAAGDAPNAVRLTPGPADLVPFHRSLAALRDGEVSRDLGIALMTLLNRRPPRDVQRHFAAKALPLLEGALRVDDHDDAAWKALGDALWAVDRRAEALDAYERILARHPEAEAALHAAGALALELGQFDTARSYLERAVRVNPWHWHYHHQLAAVSYSRGEWERSARECEQSLRLDPANPAPRSLLLLCHIARNEKEKAQGEYERLRHLTAEDRRADLRQWYEEEQRLGPRKHR